MEVAVENKLRYDKYKDSGVEWLGEIPEHWAVNRLASIGKFSSSGIDKLYNINESKVRIINYTDVYRNRRYILDSSIDYMIVTTPEENRVKSLVNKGDLIFLPSSETFEDLGLCALVNEQMENISFSYHVLRFEFNKKVNHNFKKYFTNNTKVLNQFSGRGTGSIRKTLNRIDFRNTLVILPSLLEQQAIANFLDDKCSKIDEAVEIKQKQITLLKERRQITIHQAVTRGLDKNVPLKDSGIDWIGEIPEHWKIVKNKTLFKETKLSGQEDLPLLSVSIHNGVSSEELKDEDNVRGRVKIADKTEYKLVEKDDIVFNMMRAWQGAIGSVTVKGLVSPAYVVARPIRGINSKFFELQYRTYPFIQQMNQSSKGITDFRKRLYWDEFKQLFTVITSVQEQNEISSYIETASKKIDTAISIKEKEIDKLREYKTTLINSAVTGKIKIY